MPFACVNSEGGLLPLDLLEQVYEGEVVRQRPVDFGLSPERRVIDEAAGIWTAVRYFWGDFKRKGEALPAEDRGTSLTRSEWVEPLLRFLGYALRFTPRAARVGSATYAISHRALSDQTREADQMEEAPPVHIASFRQSLEHKPEGERLSPHTLVQDYLNRSDHLWGVVTNGLTLRLLRESAHLSRPAFLEFDLEQMLEGDHFSDFVLMYRLLHRSRLSRTIADARDCVVEKYFELAQEQGGRIRERLREGVEEALQVLGNGFLQHPTNQALRAALQRQDLTPQGFYGELLHLVYRFLFLMVAEERGLLTDHPVYLEHYSLRRLRELCQRPVPQDRFDDLYRGLRVTFEIFRDERVARHFNTIPLNGDLFASGKTLHLEPASLYNRDLLRALRRLSLFREDRRSALRRVNYAALDVEELGSVYESLLEFEPVVRSQGGRTIFEFGPGTERRSTGSYYTHPDLVKELVDHALVPVMEERLRGARTTAERERRLLSLKVCDPATGSGHFLLAAARRIGRELARVRSGDDEPTPSVFRKAVREVITHCIYGVDKNPLAVDLCKVALWIEGHTKGMPLTFLDHRIKVGDSLVGVGDLQLLHDGIPDEAYDRSDREQKKLARDLKAQNRRERTGQLTLEEGRLQDQLLSLALVVEELERMPDDSPQRVAQKAQKYEAARGHGTDWWRDMTACHLWTSPFFIDLTQGDVPTTSTVRRYLANPGAGSGPQVGKAWRLAQERRFFHWPLEFPEVFMNGGFDVALSNPPFMGGMKLSTVFGDVYRNYLITAFSPAGGTADLCAYFYRRVFDVLRNYGHLGMVATNTIGQGDTRQGGLAFIARNGGTINFAHRFIKWPGAASVEVNLLSLYKGTWGRPCELDGHMVPNISSRLTNEPEVEPEQLEGNEGKAFIGTYVLGLGFLMSPEEAEELIHQSSRNRNCLFPYLTGDDINSRPDESPSRWVINFFNWPLSKAEQHQELLRIVREKVKPERDELGDNPTARRRKEYWWQYGRSAANLYEAITGLPRVLVRSRVSEMHVLAFVPATFVYSEGTVVFAFDDHYHFALLQSNVHEAWVRRNGIFSINRGKQSAGEP